MFPDGVFWVSLQALRRPRYGRARDRRERSALNASRVAHVADKRLLVLFDNFEQVIAAAPIVPARCWPATPPRQGAGDQPRAAAHQGRSSACRSSRWPTHDAAVPVYRARPRGRPRLRHDGGCRRRSASAFDNLPLAIELAAARVTLLEPDELLARL